MNRFQDFRQRNWDRSLRRAARHPRVATVVFWWLTAMVVGEAAFVVANAIQAHWRDAASYSLALATLAFLRWTWAHMMRGDPTPPVLRLRRA